MQGEPSPRTVEQAAHEMVDELAHDDLPVLPAMGTAFFEAPAARKRIVRNVLHPSRRRTPGAFDPMLGELTVQTVLVLLNGVVTSTFVETMHGPTRGPRAWLHRRRVARLLAQRTAVAGVHTLVPTFPAAVAQRIAEEARWITVGAGIPSERADRLVALLATVLTQPN